MIGFLAQPLVRWGAIASTILGLVAAVWVQSARLAGTQAARDAAVQAANLISQDRNRLVVATAERDKVIAMLNKEMDRFRADIAHAEQASASVAAANRKVLNDLRRTQVALKEKARAHPDQVRPLGSVAAAFAGGLQP